MIRNYIRLCLFTTVFSAALICACTKEDSEFNIPDVTTDHNPALTLSDNELTVDSTAGGTYSVIYFVTDPADNGKVSAAADVDWIGGFEYPSGTVRFKVDASGEEAPRSGVVTVTYSHSGGYSVSAAVTVTQVGSDPFVMVTVSTVDAGSSADSYSFTYTVVNPASDGEISCSASEDWIEVTGCSGGTVTFTTDDNEEYKTMRYGVVSVLYRFNGKFVETPVFVNQEGSPIIVHIEGEYTATAAVGSSAEIEEWTLTICVNDTDDELDVDYGYYIDGMIPSYAGRYIEYSSHRYSARAKYIDGQIIVPPQVYLGYERETGGGTYMGYVTSTGTSSGSYSLDLVTTFTYDDASGEWHSDYGIQGINVNTDLLSRYSTIEHTTAITLVKNE